jgi:hypothetical protein
MGLVRQLNKVLNAVDKRINLRKFNQAMDAFGIPFHIAPISHWYVETLWQLQGLFGVGDLWYPWGCFKKQVKDVYSPKRWGGWFWLFEVGSRG